MDQRLSEALHPLLHDYFARVDQALPGLVIGFYIHGGIALDAFNPHFSDVDFIAVISRRCTPQDVARLSEIHNALKAKYPLEGSYLQPEDLGQPESKIPPCPAIHDGVLQPEARFDLSAVTWWVLKNHGITLRGTPAQQLPFEVDWQLLIAAMKINLNTYWSQFIRNPIRMLWLLDDRGIEWAILGVLRQYYSFREQAITSKVGAGDYALQKLPDRWHRLIREALRIRTQQETSSLYRSRFSRTVEAWRFLRYIIRASHDLA